MFYFLKSEGLPHILTKIEYSPVCKFEENKVVWNRLKCFVKAFDIDSPVIKKLENNEQDYYYLISLNEEGEQKEIWTLDRATIHNLTKEGKEEINLNFEIEFKDVKYKTNLINKL